MATFNLDNFNTINQSQAHESVSAKYSFITTRRVVDVLADHGWSPNKITQAATRIEERQGYQKHMIQFSQGELVRGAEMPMIVLVNSHLGSASFQLKLGIYRVVCSNGLIVGNSVQDYRIRHVGYTDDAVSDAIKAITGNIDAVSATVDAWKGIELNRDQQFAYAESAVELLQDAEGKFAYDPRSALSIRRWDDRKDDLWTTFNRVQENVIRGGVARRNAETGRRAPRTRAVTSIDKNVALNRALWTLTEKMAQLAA